jgi:predicted hydrocarbon binding protein
MDEDESQLSRRLAAELETLAPRASTRVPTSAQVDVTSGVWRRAGGERTVLLTASLLFGMREGWGDEAAARFYHCGRNWGQELALRLEAEARRRFSSAALEAPAEDMLRLCDEILAGEGWGRLAFDFGRREAGLVEARIENSACAESFGDLGRPGCHLYAGMLAGLVSVYARRDLEACEIACRCAGAERCHFVLGRADRLQPVETWLADGCGPAQILERLMQAG